MANKITQDGDSYFVGEGDGRVEVDLSGFVSESSIGKDFIPKAHFESEITRRIKSATKGLANPDELLKDDGFVDRVVEARRDELVKRLSVKPQEADVARIREQITKTDVEPLKTRLTEAEKRNEKLKARSWRADFMEAAVGTGVDDELLDLVADHLRGKFEFADEYGEFVAVDKDGEPILSATLGKGRAHPYQTVADVLGEIAASGTRKSWFKAAGQTGAGVKGGQRGGRGVTVDDFRKMSDADRVALWERDPEGFRTLMEGLRQDGEKRLTGR